MNILVTGFDPFGGEAINPALEAIKQLPKYIAGATIEVLEIPTVFQRSAQVLEEKILKFNPDAVLCVGQAGGRTHLTLERVAINMDDARIPDNEGNQPIDLPIQATGAPAYFSTLPIKAMVHAIQTIGLPASISNSAGTYVCNHLMYQALYLANTKFPRIKVGFMHIPYLPEQVTNKPHQPSMSVTDITRGMIAAIETIVLFDTKNDLKISGGSIH